MKGSPWNVEAESLISRRQGRPLKIITIRHKIETEQQILFFDWANYCATYNARPLALYCHHIPNGGARHVRIAIEMKRMGVRPGIPDMHCVIPSGGFHSFWGEFKAPGGPVTEKQAEQHALLRAEGHYVTVEYSASAMAEELIRYLKRGCPGTLTVRQQL